MSGDVLSIGTSSYIWSNSANKFPYLSGTICTPKITLHTQVSISWWRHQVETFSALLALCEGNLPVPGGFPSQRPVTRSFEVFFDLCLNKRLSKQPKRRWLGMIWYDMIWYDMIWYDMIWYEDMIWGYDMRRIWYDKIWYDMIWYPYLNNMGWFFLTGDDAAAGMLSLNIKYIHFIEYANILFYLFCFVLHIIQCSIVTGAITGSSSISGTPFTNMDQLHSRCG